MDTRFEAIAKTIVLEIGDKEFGSEKTLTEIIKKRILHEEERDEYFDYPREIIEMMEILYASFPKGKFNIAIAQKYLSEEIKKRRIESTFIACDILNHSRSKMAYSMFLKTWEFTLRNLRHEKIFYEKYRP